MSTNGLRSSDGRLVRTARSHILADFVDTRARRKPLKPLRAGMPGDFGVLVVTRVLFTTTKCTRDRGCIVRPAFPTPPSCAPRSLARKPNATPRAPRAARTKSYPKLYQRHCERSEAIHRAAKR